MTEREALSILTLLFANYPDTTKNDTDEIKQARAKIWIAGLRDIDYDIAKNVTLAHILSDKSAFAPNIATMRDKMTAVTATKPEMDEYEAWSLVRKALGNSYYNGAEEFAKLPDPVRKAVGSAQVLKDWGLLDADSLSVAQSHFMRSYRTLLQRAREDRTLPSALKLRLEKAHEQAMLSASDVLALESAQADAAKK